jgi:hypothetical protein
MDKCLCTIGTFVTPALVITGLHMAGNTILTKCWGVNRDYLIQNLHKKSNLGQRLPMDLKALAFIFKHLFIDKTTTL